MQVKEEWASVSRWINDRASYAGKVAEKGAAGAPRADLYSRDIARMLEVGQIEATTAEQVRGHVRVFAVPEVAKGRKRAIKHTRDINDVLGKETLIGQKVAGKRESIGLASKGPFMAALDFAAWFDQIELSPEVRDFFCFRVNRRLYRLKRLAMGQRQSVDVAATLTKLLLDFDRRSHAESCIDNVVFCGSREHVRHDLVQFLGRCKHVGAQLNEIDVDASPEEIDALIKTSGDWGGVAIDLTARTVALAQKTVDKTHFSWDRRQEWTYRRFAAHIGLLFWSCGILQLPMAEFYPLLKFISDVGRLMQADESLWDTPANVWPSVWPTLEGWTARVFRNAPRRVQQPTPPSWLVCCDASRWGWGYIALNCVSGEVRTHGARWSREMEDRHGDRLGHSTLAEPLGVTNSMCHLLRPTERAHVKVGTDSTVAVASFNRGYNARSFDINECLRRLSSNFGDHVTFEPYVHVPGVHNLADGLSRGQAAPESSAVTESLRRWLG